MENPSIIEICTRSAIEVVFDTRRRKAKAAIPCAGAPFSETDQNIREEMKHMHFGINELSIKQQFVIIPHSKLWKLCQAKSVAMFYEFSSTFHVFIFIFLSWSKEIVQCWKWFCSCLVRTQ